MRQPIRGSNGCNGFAAVPLSSAVRLCLTEKRSHFLRLRLPRTKGGIASISKIPIPGKA